MRYAEDPRLLEPEWPGFEGGRVTGMRVRLMALLTVPFVLWYFVWLLQPDRIGNPVLYVVLVIAELFNAAQALGFWWTSAHERRRRTPRADIRNVEVDVLIPVYDEPLEVVAPTIEAARRIAGARVNVVVCDDGARSELEQLAKRQGARYVARAGSEGAKAGNLNHALRLTSAPYIAVLDCDHVPDEAFLEQTLGHFVRRNVALVQTPQYYANHRTNALARAAWSQQALFFGCIARGKDGLDSMFCCGTNVVFRRRALEEIEGFPQESLTEDFELSVLLHSKGWKTVYVPQVLARGLGPEDMASYVGQQQRWSRGCLSALPAVLKAPLPLKVRLQYLLSSMYFLSGWTILIYMALPVIRILLGAQPLAAAGADQFLLHFAPYFGFALLSVSIAGAGTYSFSAFALNAANFWIHVYSSVMVALGRPGRFVVTPKRGATERQPRAVLPALAAVAVLGASALFGLARDQGPATLNNVSFAVLHVAVLVTGAWPALAGAGAVERPAEHEMEREAA
ncbi:MAG: glycosyltransferase family 2 protein [Actinomycetota bacterium]